MKTETYILPSYLLPYLFNDDASGLTDKQQAKYDAWFAANFPHGGWAVSEDPLGFRQGSDFSSLGDDCHEITFQIPDPQPEGHQELTNGVLSPEESAALRALRARGWAVIVFTPEEVGDSDPEDVEGQAIAAANDWLQEQRST